MNETTTGGNNMIIDWLMGMKPYQARRVALAFCLLFWAAVVVTVWLSIGK